MISPTLLVRRRNQTTPRGVPNPTRVLAGMLVTALCMSAGPTRAEWVEWIVDAEARATVNDNVNYSAFSNDELDDNSLSALVSLGRVFQFSDFTRLRLTADVDAGAFNEYNKLNYTQLGATAALHTKFGIGRDAPWVRLHVMGASLGVASNIRDDSTLYEIGARVGKRITSRLDATAGVAYRSRNGRDNNPVVLANVPTNVFDQDSTTVSLSLDYLLGERFFLTAGYSYRDGEFDSACTGPNVARVLAAENVKAITFDDAFKLTVPMCAYKLDGTVHLVELGLSYALGQRSSLRLGVEHRSGEGKVLTYDNTLGRLAFIYFH